MGRLGGSKCMVHLVSVPDQPTRKQIYCYIKKLRAYCPVSHMCNFFVVRSQGFLRFNLKWLGKEKCFFSDLKVVNIFLSFGIILYKSEFFKFCDIEWNLVERRFLIQTDIFITCSKGTCGHMQTCPVDQLVYLTESSFPQYCLNY